MLRKKTVSNNVVSGSCESGDPMLWELRGERVKLFWISQVIGWEIAPEMTYNYVRMLRNSIL